MILTQKTPSILVKLHDIYKASNPNGKAYGTLKAAIYHNNSPVNILVAITCLMDVQCMIGLDRCHPVELEYCIRYFSELTGYSPVELEYRLNFDK